MDICLNPVGELENKLFGLARQREDGSGCIGCAYCAFGASGKFNTRWQEHQYNRKTVEFNDELRKLVETLQESDTGILKSREAFSTFVRENGTDGRHGVFRWSGKLQTERHSYYIACEAGKSRVGARIYCYDNELLMPFLETHLPESCVSVLPSEPNQMICVRKGMPGFNRHARMENAEGARKQVDDLNRGRDVTRAQEEAMLAGSMFGWGVPAADPRNYDRTGRPYLPKQKSKER